VILDSPYDDNRVIENPVIAGDPDFVIIDGLPGTETEWIHRELDAYKKWGSNEIDATAQMLLPGRYRVEFTLNKVVDKTSEVQSQSGTGYQDVGLILRCVTVSTLG